jgi:predicted dehydrogenase
MSRPIGVALAGAGAIVRLTHLAALKAIDEVAPVAVLDVDAGRAAEVAEMAGDATPYTELEAMLDDERVDAVIIALPNDLHAEVAIAAAERGKHIFCEKPLAMNPGEGRKMVEAARAAGVVLQVGFNQRYWPQVQMARRLIDQGVIGGVHAFRSVYSESANVYPATTRYRYDLARSGGASIIDLAIHRIDLARYLLGDVVEVCATIDHRVLAEAVDDNVFLLMRFASGATGVISSDRFSPMVSNATDLYGDGGTIHLSTETINPFQAEPLAVSSSKPASELPQELIAHHWPTAWWEGFENGWISVRPPRNSPYEDQMRAFAAAITDGTEPPVTGEDGLAALEVVHAAYQSVAEHGWVSLPLSIDAAPLPEYT